MPGALSALAVNFAQRHHVLRSCRTAPVPAVPLTSETILEMIGPGKTASGVAVNERSSLTISSVFRAVNLIAGTAAGLPLQAYKKDGDNRVRVGDESQTARLLDDPHPDMTPFEFWETAYGHVLLWGNAYLRKVRNGLGQIVELWLLHPGRVRAGRAVGREPASLWLHQPHYVLDVEPGGFARLVSASIGRYT